MRRIKKVGDDGVEPSTSFLSGKRSTAEPIAPKTILIYHKPKLNTIYPIIIILILKVIKYSSKRPLTKNL